MFDFQPLQTLSLAMRHLPFRVSQQSLDIYDYRPVLVSVAVMPLYPLRLISTAFE